ncbi:hypothetical protein [Methylobacterium sp. Leaf469]|uniref:hypothetical protein n=1 Tax=Methylobacterium sp. Leaf469 TaxID=1736387 RepID=UPI000A8DF2AB|nr:hypothetical protein [Methylobacterium sp. Leaf469]
MSISKNPEGEVASATDVRRNVSETILISIVIAVGVNLLTSADISTYRGAFLVIFSVSAIVYGIFVIAKRAVPRVNKIYKILGTLIISDKTDKIVIIPRYRFTSDLADSMEGLFLENGAYKALWNRSEIIDVNTYETQAEFNSLPARNKFIIEAIEYYALSSLSSHLSGYFESTTAKQSISSEKIVNLSRSDIPTVLLTNRFLELFTRPMEEREAFQERNTENKVMVQITKVSHGTEDGTIVSARSSDGAIFEHFELILPKNTFITRNLNNSIDIKNKKFLINIRSVFEGWHTVTGGHFDKLYLGEDFREIKCYQCSLEISVKFPFFTLMRSSGWEYLYWIESWIKKVDDDVNFQKFQERIGWEQSLTNVIVTKNLNILRKKAEEKLAGAIDAPPQDD